MAAFPPLTRLVSWASAYIRPAQPPIPGVIPSTLAADLAAVVARVRDLEADLKTSHDAFRRLSAATNCACHQGDDDYVTGSVCQDCFGAVVARCERVETLEERLEIIRAHAQDDGPDALQR